MRHYICWGLGGLTTTITTGGLFILIYMKYAGVKDGKPISHILECICKEK